MNNKLFISFLIIYHLFSVGECFCNSNSSNFEVKVRNYILCKNYTKEERPKLNNISLELNYAIRGFDFDEAGSTLTIQSRILHRWFDLRLKWPENDYAGIQMIHVSSDDVWMPRLFINNSFHHYGLGSCHPTECIIKSNGEIGCWIPCSQTAVCDADFHDWPYDKHECRIVFRTFLTYENVMFNAEALGGTIVRNANNEWKLTSVDGVVNISNPTNVRFTFKIQRFSDSFHKHIIMPGYCLIVFTFATLLISPNSKWRLLLCGLNIYLHFGLMDRIWWQFPMNGSARDVPNVLKNMILMLSLCATVLVESIILKSLIFRYASPPLWVQNISIIVEKNSFVQYFVSTSFDSLNDEKNDQAFINFCRLIDGLIFIVFIIIYAFNNIY